MARQPACRFRSTSAGRKKYPLRSSKGKDQLFWGIHPVLEALRTSPGSIKEIILERKTGPRLEKITDLATKHNIALRHDRKIFQKDGLVGAERHQGVAARLSFPYVDLPGMLDGAAEDGNPPFILALDSIQDPQNLGAIIRSAVAAGCSNLILPKDRAAQITGAVAKTSAGAVFHTSICRVTNLVTAIDTLKEAGIWVFATSADGPLQIYQADFKVPVCLVIGNEEKGVRPLVKKHCDGLVSIPMSGELDSLNASVAAGVVLFEIARQRAR